MGPCDPHAGGKEYDGIQQRDRKSIQSYDPDWGPAAANFYTGPEGTVKEAPEKRTEKTHF